MSPSSHQPIVVALGDSTTAGTPGFQSPLEAPPSGLGDPESQYTFWLAGLQPGWKVLNRGVNGESSDQIAARFQRDVVEAGADLVVIIAGVNDIYQGVEPARVQRELERMFEMARTAARRPSVVVGSILPFNTATSEQNRRMTVVNDWLAHRRDVHYCNTRAAVASPDNPYRLASSPDDLHPSPEGYRLLALALEPVVTRALALRR